MNQGKLDVITQEIARVNIKFLGISDLKWMGMGEFNSDEHYIYHCGKNPIMQYADSIQKQQNDLLFPRQSIQYHSNSSLCPTSNAEEAEVEQFYEDLQDLLE